MRYFTADLHFGHENIIRYCSRPFASADEMDDALITNWNSVVTDDDEVWVLGDVAMAPIESGLAKVATLHGRKVLLTGNHDRCWAGDGPRHEEWIDRYRDAGFVEIHHGSIEIDLAGRRVLAGHFPYEGDSHDEDRFTVWRPIDEGAWLLHGHVHTRWKVHDRQINVGVDAWDYTPVSEVTLAEIVQAG